MRVDLSKAQYYLSRKLFQEIGCRQSGAFSFDVTADQARELFAMVTRLPPPQHTREFITRDCILDKLIRVWLTEPRTP